MIKKLLLHISIIFTSILIINSNLFAQTNYGAISPDSLVGNVYGTVKDSATGNPIVNAKIYLFTKAISKSSGDNIINTNNGTFKLPDFNSAVKYGTTNNKGKFLINFVKTPAPFKLYTIIIKANGYNDLIINQVPVLPGAVMALQINCILSAGSNESLYYNGINRNGPFIYRDEYLAKKYSKNLLLKSKPQKTKALQYYVYATREGLVGGTCANGHVIVSHDHFVALPSFKVLNKNDKTHTFEVKLTHNGKSVVAPVWDVGPWNIKDNYWEPDSLRDIYSTLRHGGKPGLGQGVPESQAAYYNNYNQGYSGDFYNTGKDYYKVGNPAGIDLADGTFWDDLSLTDNGWIKVNYLWKPGVSLGDTVFAVGKINVTTLPGGTVTGQEDSAGIGVIIAGPQSGVYNDTTYYWWKVKWSDSLTGWSVEKFIKRINGEKINVTVRTVPDSLNFSVDGKTYSSSQTFNWFADSAHTISSGPQTINSNVRYTLQYWSDRGLNPHEIFPYESKIYTAYFIKQYTLNVSSSSSRAGYCSPQGITWQNKDTIITVTAIPTGSYTFSNWSGDTTSTDNPIKITISKPFSLTANFTPATSVENSNLNIPNDYLLYQNYPNPFNPSTTIRYALPLASKVKITVYNLLGESVEQLVNETETAGYHEINFDGRKLSSGVYLYKISAKSLNGVKSFSEVRKLIMIK